MSSWIKNIIGGLVVVVILYLINATMTSAGLFGIGIDDYQARLLVFIAINIILATSLNLINGFTGQFSIGHAGFMAVGAYSSAYFTVTYGEGDRGVAGRTWRNGRGEHRSADRSVIGAYCRGSNGPDRRYPEPQAKGRLSGDRDARICRDHPHRYPQHRRRRRCDRLFRSPGTLISFGSASLRVITVVVIHNIVKSDTGRALVSIREDELAAEAMGVHTLRATR